MNVVPLAKKQIESLVELCNSFSLDCQCLQEFNDSVDTDHRFYHFLIEGQVLYSCTFGNPSRKSIGNFFSSIREISKKYIDPEGFRIILDVRGLTKLPESARKEISFFSEGLGELSNKTIYINSGVAKTILEYFKLSDPNITNSLTKVDNPQDALKYAFDLGSLQMDIRRPSDESYASYSREELIQELRQIKANQAEKNRRCQENLENFYSYVTKLSLSPQKASEEILNLDYNNEIAPAYHLVNSLVEDYKELNQTHQNLKNQFRKELGDALGETYRQEASLRAIFDSLDAILWFVDADFNLVTYNEKFIEHSKRYFGIAPEVGMNIKEHYQKKKGSLLLEQRVNLAISGQEKTYHDYYKSTNGVIKRVVETKIFPVEYENRIIGVASLSKDITESYFYKQKIKSNERILASVNKNIKEALYRSAHERGLVYINDAFVKMFGFESKEELYEHQNLDFIYANPGERNRLAKLLNEKQEVSNLEVIFRKKDGSTFTGLMSSIVTKGDDGLDYFDGAIRDISYVKQTQAQLKAQNDELSKLNDELDSFVYSASHDLKAPLSSVKGLINIALKLDDQDEVHHYLGLMDKSINKLDSFIQDIIDLSRNSRKSLNHDEINFRELLDEVFENFEFIENYEKIDKKVDIDVRGSMISDKSRLKVVLNNLISNAIRYYNPRAEKPFISIKVQAKNDCIEIVIADNGLGIEEQFLEKIYDMFFRANYNSQGSGIGLYIVKETLIKMGGAIYVESEPSEGTIFTLHLPNFAFHDKNTQVMLS